MCVNIQELSGKPPNTSGLLYTLIWLNAPLPIIENWWRNNNHFFIFRGCGIALNYKKFGGEEGIVRSFTLTTCPQVLFYAAITQLAQTTCRKIKIKNDPFEAAPPTPLLFTHKTVERWGKTEKKDVLGVRIKHFFVWLKLSTVAKLFCWFVKWFYYHWMVMWHSFFCMCVWGSVQHTAQVFGCLSCC